MRRIIMLAVTAVTIAMVMVTIALLVTSDIQGDREEFRTDCDDEGGHLIEMNHRLICRMGTITIEYGED